MLSSGVNFVSDIFGLNKGKINGTMMLMSKKVLEFNNLNVKAGINLGIDALTCVFDGFHQVNDGAVSLQMISSTKADPGAFVISNNLQNEFFLVSLTLDDIPNHASIHFVCNSWIYLDNECKSHRIFFTNRVGKLPPDNRNRPWPILSLINDQISNLAYSFVTNRSYVYKHAALFELSVSSSTDKPRSSNRNPQIPYTHFETTMLEKVFQGFG
ncbi:hypothetical protein K1719_009247 [Acacia pycnantha]|nr:hypothetical protein K1719_009247 [Acacia pycnantha]